MHDESVGTAELDTEGTVLGTVIGARSFDLAATDLATKDTGDLLQG